MGRVENKIAIVTGAESPVGAACATRLADEGAVVIATGGKAANGRVLHDPSSGDSWRELIAKALETRGHIDILVNAAQDFFLRPFLEMTLDELRGVCRSNIHSTWLGLKHVIPAMRQGGGGYIVNVTSVLGSVALADAAAYCAAAAAVRVMSRSAALECGADQSNIIVNSVQAGAVDWPVRPDSTGGAEAAAGSALSGPRIDPAEVAGAVLHLATPDAKYVTGTELVIDGGYAAS